MPDAPCASRSSRSNNEHCQSENEDNQADYLSSRFARQDDEFIC